MAIMSTNCGASIDLSRIVDSIENLVELQETNFDSEHTDIIQPCILVNILVCLIAVERTIGQSISNSYSQSI